MLFKDQIKLEFEVGNRVKPSKTKKNGKQYYDWQAFVRIKNHKDYKIESIIDKVTFELHETFPNPIRDIKVAKNNEFCLGTSGWGYFDLPMTIHFKEHTGHSKEPITINHELCFDGDGKWVTVKVPLSGKKF